MQIGDRFAERAKSHTAVDADAVEEALKDVFEHDLVGRGAITETCPRASHVCNPAQQVNPWVGLNTPRRRGLLWCLAAIERRSAG